MRLSDALDEIANGKIAVFGKMVEEAKQATNETARQKWLNQKQKRTNKKSKSQKRE